MRLKEVKEIPSLDEQLKEAVNAKPWERNLRPDPRLCSTQRCGWTTMVVKVRKGGNTYKDIVPRFVIHPECPRHGDKGRR